MKCNNCGSAKKRFKVQTERKTHFEKVLYDKSSCQSNETIDAKDGAK